MLKMGLWLYERLPFGVSIVPGIFQNVIAQVLAGIPGFCCYLDDILIGSPDKVEHHRTLDLVLSKLYKYNIKSNKAKCMFNVST